MPAICPASSPPFVVRSAAAAKERSGTPALGVVVCERMGSAPFAEAAFIRRLIRTGPRHGLQVFAFAPESWREERSSVQGWTWQSGWIRQERPVPALAYDRAWPAGAEGRGRHRAALARLVQSGRLKLLNGKLPGKAGVTRALARCPELRRWLPPAALYRSEAGLAAWLDRQGGAAFLKPTHGWQGRSVIAVVRGGDGLVDLRGRTGANRAFRLSGLREAEALARIHRWIGGRSYLMQPLLELQGPDGEPFDVRALMQRDGRGRWIVAGLAARCGRRGGVTANLHGGGEPRHAEQYLARLFGEREAAERIAELRRAAFAVVRRLEEEYGTFAELGLDFGIDRTGRCWFLEANTKPGRASMACAGGAAAAEAAERPLAYARHILLRSAWEGIS